MYLRQVEEPLQRVEQDGPGSEEEATSTGSGE